MRSQPKISPSVTSPSVPSPSVTGHVRPSHVNKWVQVSPSVTHVNKRVQYKRVQDKRAHVRPSHVNKRVQDKRVQDKSPKLIGKQVGPI